MPFLTIELSKNVNLELGSFAKEAHEYLAKALDVGLEKFKTKIFRLPETFVADGAPQKSYAHLRIEIIAGRDPQKLKIAGKELVDKFSTVLQQQNPSLSGRITFEFRELNPELFFVADRP